MNTSIKTKSQTNVFQQKYKSARANLLVMIMLTVLNIVLLFANSDRVFLFSATVPYVSMALGRALYFEWGNNVVLVQGIIVAVISLAFYLICWIFSKKNNGWLIAALVLFSADTVFMAGFYLLTQDASGIMDAIIHIFVLYYLIAGVMAGNNLKKLSTIEEETTVSEYAESNKIRHADMNAKSRILLEAEVDGKHIYYRRVKTVNELVIDGYVYDEFKALLEPPHELVACIDGHVYSAGTMHGNYAFINVDGENKIRKPRIF